MNSSADYKVCPGSIAGLVLIFSRFSSNYKPEKLLAIEYQEQELQLLRCDSRIATSGKVRVGAIESSTRLLHPQALYC
jgi:hypothetical protein